MPLIATLALLHALAFIDRTMIGGVLPLMRQSVAMTDAQAGWIVGTAFALPYGLTALIVATVRRGRPASTAWLVVGVLVWTLGSMATGLAKSPAGLTAARATLGIGQGLFVPIAIARLFDGTPSAARGQALGIFQGGATAGRSVALLAVGSLLTLFGILATKNGIDSWRWLFVVTALPNLIVVAVLMMNAAPVPQPDRALQRSPNANYWRALLPFFPVAVAPVLLAQAVLAWLPTLMVRDHGLSTPQAALLVGAITLVAAPAGPIVAGRLVGRHRAWEGRAPLLILMTLTASLVPLAATVWAPELLEALAAMAVMLVVLGMASFGGLFGVQLLVPPAARISANGVFLAFITTVGVGLGPLITGALTSATRGSGTTLGHALLVTGGIAFALCALAVLGARRSFARSVQV